jgi:hypothetical protein
VTILGRTHRALQQTIRHHTMILPDSVISKVCCNQMKEHPCVLFGTNKIEREVTLNIIFVFGYTKYSFDYRFEV